MLRGTHTASAVCRLLIVTSVVACATHRAAAASWGGLLPDGRGSVRAISHSETGSLVVVSGDALWRSDNDGRSWVTTPVRRPVTESGRPVTIEHVGVSASDPPVVYASGSSRLYRSRDAGATWEAVGGFGAPPERQGDFEAIVQIIVSPADPDSLLVATRGVRGGGMLSSLDGGESWRPVGAGGAGGAGDRPEVEFVHPHTGEAYVRYGLSELFLRRDSLTGKSTQLGTGPVGFTLGMDASDVDTVYIRGVNDDEMPFGSDWAAPTAADGVDGPLVIRSFAYYPPDGTLYAISSPRLAVVQASVAVLFATVDEGATWTQAALIPLSVADVSARKRLQLYFLPGSQFMYLHTGASVYRTDLAATAALTADGRVHVTWAALRRAP